MIYYVEKGYKGGKAININMQEEISFFNIQKWNDYVHVQKTVWEKLVENNIIKREGTLVKNIQTDMMIEIGHSGIKETLGPGEKYLNLKREMKEMKISVVRYLPQLLQSARLLEDDVLNYHGGRMNTKYAYFFNEVMIDNKPFEIIFDVRKSAQKNKFWVHRIMTKSRDTDYVERIANHT